MYFTGYWLFIYVTKYFLVLLHHVVLGYCSIELLYLLHDLTYNCCVVLLCCILHVSLVFFFTVLVFK